MRRAPPVRRRNRPARTGKLLFQRDIEQIAAHRELAAAHAHRALHQHFRAAALPHGEDRRLHFAIERLRQSVGTAGLEQAIVAQIARDDPRQAAPELGGGTRSRAGCGIGVSGEIGDGDAKVLPIGVVGDVNRRLGWLHRCSFWHGHLSVDRH